MSKSARKKIKNLCKNYAKNIKKSKICVVIGLFKIKPVGGR